MDILKSLTRRKRPSSARYRNLEETEKDLLTQIEKIVEALKEKKDWAANMELAIGDKEGELEKHEKRTLQALGHSEQQEERSS